MNESHKRLFTSLWLWAHNSHEYFAKALKMMNIEHSIFGISVFFFFLFCHDDALYIILKLSREETNVYL